MWLCNAERGYTITELLVAISIMAILSSLALPNFSVIEDSFERFTAKSNLLQDIKYAQSHTLKEGCRGIFTIAGDGNSYSYGCDYLSYDTSDPAAADQTKLSRTLPPRMTISTSSQIIFNSRGQSVDLGGEMREVTININLDGNTVMTGSLSGLGLFSMG